MGYTVMLEFDKESQNKINEIIRVIYENGVNSFMIDTNGNPHIAIASYGEINEEEFYRRLKEFSAKTRRFELRFESVGIFYFERNIIYLSPVITDELIRVHEEFHSSFDSGCCKKPFEHYLPNKWVPNCRVAVNATMEESLSAIASLSSIFKPFNIRVEGISVVDFNTLEYIAMYEFKK
jgi:hypothetical protein